MPKRETLSRGRNYSDYLKWRMVKGFAGEPASKEKFEVVKSFFDERKYDFSQKKKNRN